MATPWKDPRTGTYYLYRKIPAQFREEMAGKTFVRRSLDTKDPKEAARRFTTVNAAFEGELDRARIAADARAARDEISSERAAALVEAFVRNDAGQHWERWPSLSRLFWLEDLAHRHHGAMIPGAAPVVAESQTLGLDRLRGERLVGDTWLETIRAVSRAKWMTCCRMVLDPIFESAVPPIPRTAGNEAAIMDAFNVRVAKDNEQLHLDADSPRNHRPATRLRPKMRLSELLELWAVERRPTKQTEHETRQSVKDLIAYYGDIPASILTRDMLLDYRDAAKNLPFAMPKADRELPFMVRLEMHGAPGGKKVSPATLKKRMSGVQSLLGLAHGEGWLEHNVGARLPIAGYTRAIKVRRSFRDGELATLFGDEIFLHPNCWFERDTIVSDLTLAWLFLLGATSGARIEEVGQAHIADVQIDAGVRFIDIDDRVLGTAGGADAKSLKNDISRRILPIHKQVLDLGFMSYVEALSELGQTTLFPDLQVNQFGKRSKEASRRANRSIDDVVGEDPRLVFHSLRHKFKDEGRSVGISDSLLDQMTGHSPASVGARYGDGAPLRVLAKQMARIKFSMIDWDAICSAFAQVDWRVVVEKLEKRSTELRNRPIPD